MVNFLEQKTILLRKLEDLTFLKNIYLKEILGITHNVHFMILILVIIIILLLKYRV